MIVRNFLDAEYVIERCHDGIGEIKNVELFKKTALLSALRFINYAEIPPGSSIGLHRHGNDEEVYVILSGTGTMTVDGKTRTVKEGDVVLNKPYCEHSLVNDSDNVLRALIFEADIGG